MSQSNPSAETILRRETRAAPRQLVRSPEQVALDLEIAGPMSRAMAFSIDYGIILVVEIIVFVALLFAAMSMMEVEQVANWISTAEADLRNGEISGEPWMLAVLALWVVLEFVLQFGYFVASELLMQGRSLGKSLVGLRVVRDGGLPVTLRESMLRNLLRVVDMLPVSYLVGSVSMIASRETRRLGDFAAGTIVVREHRGELVLPLDIASVPARGTPAFRFDRGQLAALGPVEQRLARQTLRRLEGLSQAEGERVLARAVAALCERIRHTEAIAPTEAKAFLMALLRDVEQR